jgi:uncharacterized membrane protein YoaK (UPF0700 family)
MHRLEPSLLALAICLATLAGFVDAIAYTSLGGFFAAFMSGNTTRLGVALGTARFDEARTAVTLLMCFVSGVMLATVIGRAWPQRQQAAVMAVVTALLALSAIATELHPGMPPLLFLAIAMGAENGMFARDGGVSTGLAGMSGALVRLGEQLAGALMGDPDRTTWIRYLMLWIGFAGGALLGVRCHGVSGYGAVWVAAAGAAVLTVAISVVTGRSDRPRP